jgi:hypothetical protein
MTSHTHFARPTPIDTRLAGIVILLAAILSIVFVALDTGASGSDPAAIMQSMVQGQQMHRVVHIVAMACLAGFMYGYTALSQKLGLQRAPVAIGLVTYGMGVVLMLIATLIDGFISVDTAAAFVTKSSDALLVGYRMIQVMENIALTDIARVSWIFQSAAAIAWSCALLADGGFRRKVGVAGLIAGALPAAAVIAAGSNMTITVVVGVLLLQAAWNVAAAILLVREGGTQTPDVVARANPALAA